MKEKKNEKKLYVASSGFEPTPQLPPAQEVRQQTTGPCGQCTIYYMKLMILKYFSLPFTLFEPNVELYLSQTQIYI